MSCPLTIPPFSSEEKLSLETDEQDVKPAKEIVDDMIKEAKQCLERGAKLGGGARSKL